ncbi:DUF4387 domain-containing protein [Sphingomonas sp.]|uniref:DUF4387 domain-containing protein n=1 Tax=Sphingomonas sp. TaxID=28214 RepID=UPI0025F61A5F|nr:DUF4387 domain-containing protein [Sphingomonas sp.]
MRNVPTIRDLAKLVRSKNAGPFELTFDVMFDDAERYRMVKESGAVTRETLARAYAIDPGSITNFQFFDPALAFKLTIRRPRPQGSIGETDTFGAQQHAPLLALEVAVPE